jgi:hypothetical protein
MEAGIPRSVLHRNQSGFKAHFALIKLKPKLGGGGGGVNPSDRLPNQISKTHGKPSNTIIQHKGCKISVAEHSTLPHFMNLNLTANVTLAQPTDLRKRRPPISRLSNALQVTASQRSLPNKMCSGEEPSGPSGHWLNRGTCCFMCEARCFFFGF